MTELVIIRAADRDGLIQETQRLIAFLDRVPDVSFLDVAYTASLTRGERALSIIADGVPSLRERLISALSRLQSSTFRRIRDKSGVYAFSESLLGPGRGKLAFIYPGVMSYYPDMLRDLAIFDPVCRRVFDELEEALAGEEDFRPSDFIFPPAACYRRDADIFKSGAYAQALVAAYSASAAVSLLLEADGIRPDGVVGFAGGDLAAMMRSGSAGDNVSRQDRVKVVSEIYRIVSKAVNHGGLPEVSMLSVVMRHAGEIEELIQSFPAEKVMLAVDLSPRQKTFAVAVDYESEVIKAFTEAGVRVTKLALDRPFNTPLCESLVPVIRKFALAWMKKEVACEMYSCASADRAPTALKGARDETAERWAKPVRFTETIRRMYEDGYRVFLEVGPRGLMAAAVADTLKGEEHAAIAVNSIHRSGVLQLQHALGQLAALGQELDLSRHFERRGAKKLDFDSVISMEVRKTAEMQLSRLLPKLTLLSEDAIGRAVSFHADSRGRGAKAAQRAAVVAQSVRRQRQFDFGAANPMVADADHISCSPGVSIEICKTIKLNEMPFIGDFALGTSQMSYSDPNLRGLILLSLPVGAEIMAETAGLVVPNRNLLRIEELVCRRWVSFERGELKLYARAEHVASTNAGEIAVRVLLRDDRPDSEYTRPVMEATIVLTDSVPEPRPVKPDTLSRPRSVHWSGRDIYPARLSCGKRLRGITFVDAWSENGLDYELTVPPLAGNVNSSRFPMWAVNPILLETAVSGFQLWRSHEKFTGAFSFPFRCRRISLFGFIPSEGSILKCYFRLNGVTPSSHISDISITDGNGKELMAISGWEEMTERVPNSYRSLILQPATTFLTEPLSLESLGHPATDVASAMITDVPYRIFERNEELWLRTLSSVVLGADERRDFAVMTGSAARRTEWLFGRVAAKEAVRRYLKEFYQARWSDADVQIWPDDNGKPHALGLWNETITTKLDIAIAHTEQFIVALAAANQHVGIDVESVARDLSEEFTAGVFTPEELELAATASSSSVAIIRFWCAKEAVSKALGIGIRYSPKEMTVVAYDSDSGDLAVRLNGAWAEAFKKLKGRDIAVKVCTLRDHALATCFIPSAIFSED